MSLKDVLSFIDDKLEAVFHSKPHDPSKARQPVLKRIVAAKHQFESGTTKVPNRWWTVSNNVVAFKPTVNGKPLLINGKPVSHVPAERFPNFLDKLYAAVEAGELDNSIEPASGPGDHFPWKEKAKRKQTPQGSVNIKVSGMRRGGKSDADIRAALKAEGVDSKLVEIALARPNASKKK